MIVSTELHVFVAELWAHFHHQHFNGLTFSPFPIFSSSALNVFFQTCYNTDLYQMYDCITYLIISVL